MNENIEDILKQRFLNKYYFIIENMDLINSLYFGKINRESFYQSMEELLFCNDELLDNSGYNYFNYLKYFKGLIVTTHYKNYKKRRIAYYNELLKNIPLNNKKSIDYYNEKIKAVENLSEEDFIKKMDFNKLIEIMREYLEKQEKHHKNKEKKLNVLYLYQQLHEAMHTKEKVDDFNLDAVERNKESYVKTNDFINYFSNNKETFNAEFVRKRNENRNK